MPIGRGSLRPAFAAALVSLVFAHAAVAADHSDAPLLSDLGRSDLRITDLFVFTRGDSLVLALCTDPAVPPGVDSYLFASDMTITFHLDRHSRVAFDDPADLLQFGGTIARPRGIAADVWIEVDFNRDGRARLRAPGIRRPFRRQVSLFAGLRDDPFIRLPREGRNVAAVVVELPLAAVQGANDTLLVWATTSAPGPDGTIGDHAGRALRSMFIEPSNLLSPRQQYMRLGMVPDVVILDVARAAVFPNGREVDDDVVDLVVDLPAGTLPGEAPTFPRVNDVPFLPEFPYLAPPQ